LTIKLLGENMPLEVKPRKRILLWCSPGFGVVDIWLPVIRKLKEKGGVTIDFVFPEPSSLRLEDKDSDLFNFSEQFANKVIYRGYSGRWFISDTLIEASAGIKFSGVDRKISNISAVFLKGRLSKYFFLNWIGKIISGVFRKIIYIKENLSHSTLYDTSLFENASGILCDITAEGKLVNKELTDECSNILKFSMLHGLAPHWVTHRLISKDSVTRRNDVRVYSMSNLEENWYKKYFGILDDNLMQVGIPRHDSDWIDFISRNSHSTENNMFDKFVFIIGRPAGPYNTSERKSKALRNIYDIVCKKHKLKLVIKTHPKESLNGIDGNIYSTALGLKNYGKDWMYSNSHPFVIGKRAIFSISFFSGVPLDMLAINKPTIEYLDLSGLTLYDNCNSLRDIRGKPVFEFSYTNLVLSASSKLELRQHVELILNNYDPTLYKLREKYKFFFRPYDNSSEIVAKDIYKNLS